MKCINMCLHNAFLFQSWITNRTLAGSLSMWHRIALGRYFSHRLRVHNKQRVGLATIAFILNAPQFLVNIFDFLIWDSFFVDFKVFFSFLWPLLITTLQIKDQIRYILRLYFIFSFSSNFEPHFQAPASISFLPNSVTWYNL